MKLIFNIVILVLVLGSVALSYFALQKQFSSDIVFNALNQCESIEPQEQITTNCNEVCSRNGNRICIKEDVAVYDTTINKWIFDTGGSCGMGYGINNTIGGDGIKIQCLCCNTLPR